MMEIVGKQNRPEQLGLQAASGAFRGVDLGCWAVLCWWSVKLALVVLMG